MADKHREGCECDDCGECSCCYCSECRVVDLYLYNCCYCCKTCNCGYLCCPEECHCCKRNACCRDEENIGHHFAAHWWLCFVSYSCVGCCNQRRRQESPDVNAPSVLTPPGVHVGAAQTTSYKKACEKTVTSQPMKS